MRVRVPPSAPITGVLKALTMPMRQPKVSMCKHLALAASLSVWLGACATDDDSMSRLAVAPGSYRIYNCAQIAAQAKSVGEQEEKLVALMQKAGTSPSGRLISDATYRPDYLVAHGQLRELACGCRRQKIATRGPVRPRPRPRQRAKATLLFGDFTDCPAEPITVELFCSAAIIGCHICDATSLGGCYGLADQCSHHISCRYPGSLSRQHAPDRWTRETDCAHRRHYYRRAIAAEISRIFRARPYATAARCRPHWRTTMPWLRRR